VKNKIYLIIIVSLFFLNQNNIFTQTYNNLWIPDTISGTQFNLNIRDTFAQIVSSGNQTITGAINGKFWGPTLLFNRGEEVHLNVRNYLNDSTTIHWHGMHLPAVMDGGPHQVIPPGTIWQPYWKVNNEAGTYWYHPHLHEMTLEHISKGIGGFIIVRDTIESKLNLPRTYGVDDIPLVLTSRKFNTSNQFVVQDVAYGDYLLTNGAMNSQVTLPKQIVRLRILNAEIERGYNLGFSDNRTFYIIGNDGGLLDAPVAVTRVKLMVGERIEILLDLSKDNSGSSIDLKAFNSGQTFGFPGGEPATSGPFGSLLNNKDFTVLHINISNTLLNAINQIPIKLVNNNYLKETDATATNTLNITGGQQNTPFTFDNTPFVLSKINKSINFDEVQKWTIVNNNIFGHSFHIHDVQFKIVARNGKSANVGIHESGWKDVMYVPLGENVSFVAKFADYADEIHPFMYHCHFANHEDGGMMGQFIVKNPTSVEDNKSINFDFSIYPNPAENKLYVYLSNNDIEVYYVTISNSKGKTVMMLPQPEIQKGIDISNLTAGAYFIQIIDKKTKSISTQQFVKK
jgi:blue copper oxidase